ncbi:hypothetical protein TI39_contig350g00025 [Zymoseptoria brevis]|uniref:Uncharacterized protein n=1 Tax=Zymoseptoria brevis TaxID=1047168 RepID=A0A0F4GUD9_9PEZI|nr:hypothetical protein TI39_contig350g00025 [Zymoseptoria brevis]
MDDFYRDRRPSTSSSQHVPKYLFIHSPKNSSSSLYHFTYPTFDPSSPVPSIRHTRRSIIMTRQKADLDFQAALATAALPPDHPHARKIKLPTPVRDDEAGRSTRSLTRRKSFIQKLKAKISRKDLRSAAQYDEDAKSIANSKFLRGIRRESSSLYSHNLSAENLTAYRPITPILPTKPTRRSSHKCSPSLTNIAYTPVQTTTPTRTSSHERSHNAYTSTQPTPPTQPLSLRRSVSAHAHPSASLDGASAPSIPPLNPTRVRRQALLPTNGDDQLMTLAIEKHERQKALFRSASKHGISTGGTTPSPFQRPRASTFGTMGTVSSFKSGIAPGDPGQSKGDVDDSAEKEEGEEKRTSKIFSDSQTWTVFASHTRGERCGSAGRKDAMSAKDFAVEAVRKMEAGTRETGAASERRVRSGTAPQGEVFGPQLPPEAISNRTAEGEEEPPRSAKLPAFLFPLQKRRSVSNRGFTTTHSKSKSTSDAERGLDTKSRSAPPSKEPTHNPSKSKSFLRPPPALTRFTRYYTSLLTTSTTFRGTNRRTSVSAATGALAHPELEMLSVAPTEGTSTTNGGLGKVLKEVDERLDKEEERTGSAWGVGVDLGTIGGEIGGWSGRGGSVFEVKGPGTGESGVSGWGGLRGLGIRSENDGGDDGDEEDEDEPPGVAEVVEFGVGEVKRVRLGQLDGAEEERVMPLLGRKERGAEHHAR